MRWVSTMKFSKIEQDRILQALLEIVGDKFGAEITGHLERRDSDGRNVG
jgi:hypothetical protein